MNKKLVISRELDINASAQNTWEIIGPNFINIADWARGINKSWDNKTAPKEFASAPSGGRYCDVAGFGEFDEKILHFDEDKLEISWSATGSKLPGFLTDLQNVITVTELSDSTCRVSSNISANLQGFSGFLLGFILKKNFEKTIHGFLTDWKAYAETGQVSITKERELANKS